MIPDPIAELKKLRGERLHLTSNNIAQVNRRLSGFRFETYEIIAELEPGTATEIGFKIRKGASEETLVGYRADATEVFIDRVHSGHTGFSKDFPGRHAGPVDSRRQVRMHLFVDTSSVELFCNDGGMVLSDRIFPSPGSERLELYAHGAGTKIGSFGAWKLQSTWRGEATVD